MVIPDYKENAIGLAKQHKGVAAFVDSSARNNLVGIGIYWQGIQWRSTTNTISTISALTNSLGELAGIEAVVAQIWNAVTYKSLENIELTVFSDSQYALKALKRLGQDSGQFLIGSIARLSHNINSSTKTVKVGFQWCPAHSNVPGNEKAHKLAQRATEKGKNVHPSLGHFLWPVLF